MRDTILIAIAGLIFMFATGIAKADTVKTVHGLNFTSLGPQ